MCYNTTNNDLKVALEFALDASRPSGAVPTRAAAPAVEARQRRDPVTAVAFPALGGPPIGGLTRRGFPDSRLKPLTRAHLRRV